NVNNEIVCKKKYVLQWNVEEDSKKPKNVWDTQEFDISNIFMIYKMAAVDKAKKHTLSYINTVGEILALSSILLMEENSFRGMTGLPQDIYQIMRRKFGKKSLPKEVIELCQRCAIVGRENSKTDLENEIDEAYIVIRKSVSSENQKLYRTVRQNWRTSFNEGISIEDTFVHHSLYPLLRPFFPDTVNWVINWANKESLSSTFGSKPDFNVAIRLCDHNYFEILFGLFKSPKKANTKSASIDLVDLGNVMKDSIDFIYHNYHTDLEIRTYGLHVFGYNARIYVMGLNFDGVYQMYLLGEFELSRSHLSFSLVEGAIYQISNLSMIVEEDIKRLNSSPMTPITTKLMSPTMKMTMTRSTV
ncbi:12131_t:CDS:2, partial [Entrophospora sp. SA101]